MENSLLRFINGDKIHSAFALRCLSSYAFKEAQTLGCHGLIESRLRFVFWVFSVSIDFNRFFILQKRAEGCLGPENTREL